MANYDLLVIGTGPAGQKAAVQAAKLGKKVGIVEKREVVGGVCINTGTIPSKSLREAVLYLSGFRQRKLYGAGYRLKDTITIEDLIFRATHVVTNEIRIVQDQMRRNSIDVIYGTASFADQHRLRVQQTSGIVEHTAHFFVIAVGTEPARPPEIPFDNDSIIDTDGLLTLKRLPSSIVIVGGGVIGTEYASILATLGIPVTLIDKRPRLLEFVDAEIIETLQRQMKEIGVALYHEEEVVSIRKEPNGRIAVTLQQAKPIETTTLMYAIGRVGATRPVASAVPLGPSVPLNERYRIRRHEALAGIARRAAAEALASGRPVELEPMTSVERKHVHLLLKDDTRVETGSDGAEPNRNSPSSRASCCCNRAMKVGQSFFACSSGIRLTEPLLNSCARSLLNASAKALGTSAKRSAREAGWNIRLTALRNSTESAHCASASALPRFCFST